MGFSVAGWQATRHLHQALELILATGVGRTVVFHGLWGLGRSTQRKQNDESMAARVLLNAIADLPLEVLVQVPRGVVPADLQRALDGQPEDPFEQRARKRIGKKSRRT